MSNFSVETVLTIGALIVIGAAVLMAWFMFSGTRPRLFVVTVAMVWTVVAFMVTGDIVKVVILAMASALLLGAVSIVVFVWLGLWDLVRKRGPG